jgi:hypothetical protein
MQHSYQNSNTGRFTIITVKNFPMQRSCLIIIEERPMGQNSWTNAKEGEHIYVEHVDRKIRRTGAITNLVAIGTAKLRRISTTSV